MTPGSKAEIVKLTGLNGLIAIPEPATLLLLSLGAVMFRKKAAALGGLPSLMGE